MVKTKARGLSLENQWNNVVECVENLRGAWEKHQFNMIGETSLELLSDKAQRVLAPSFHKSDFELAIPLLIGYFRTRGGLDELRLETEDKQLTKELEEEDE